MTLLQMSALKYILNHCVVIVFCRALQKKYNHCDCFDWMLTMLQRMILLTKQTANTASLVFFFNPQQQKQLSLHDVNNMGGESVLSKMRGWRCVCQLRNAQREATHLQSVRLHSDPVVFLIGVQVFNPTEAWIYCSFQSSFL